MLAANPLVVTNTNDSGPSSLRWAIEQANLEPGPNLIEFNIPSSKLNYDADVVAPNRPGADVDSDVFIIRLLTALPSLTDGGTIVDGRTQAEFSGDTNPFGPEIVIDGSDSSGSSRGLQLESDDNQIIGLNIQGFGQSGILIHGSNSWIAANYVGTDATGTTAAGNARSATFWAGIQISRGQGNIIGTDGDGTNDQVERNLVSGNNGRGIWLTGRAHHNSVAGNYVGTDATGSISLANANDGVTIAGGASSNRVGTNGDGISDAVERNVVAGNAAQGILIRDVGSDCNIIAGNHIGIDAGGTNAVGNGTHAWQSGVRIANGAQRNLIGTDGDGAADQAERNVVSGNLGHGIVLEHNGTDENVIAGNFVGTDAGGVERVPNGGRGIVITTGSSANRVGTNGDGTSDDAERNVVSGNMSHGIQISGAGTQHNVVAGNYVGTTSAGDAALGNLAT